MKNQGLFHENITMQEHDRREDSKTIRSQHATNLVFFWHGEEKNRKKWYELLKIWLYLHPISKIHRSEGHEIRIFLTIIYIY